MVRYYLLGIGKWTLFFLLLFIGCTKKSKPGQDAANEFAVLKENLFINSSGDTSRTGVNLSVSGRRLNNDSLLPPTIIPLQNRLESFPIHDHIQVPGTPKVIPVNNNNFTIKTPGKNGTPVAGTMTIPGEVAILRHAKPNPAMPPRTKDFTTYDIQQIGVDQGLMSAYTRFLLEDSRGFLWFGSSHGISRYDGSQFFNYTVEEGLMENAVFSILEDRRGHFWFGTKDGISRYDGRQITHYRLNMGIRRNEIKAIIEDDRGDLWFGTGKGVLRYQPEKNGLDGTKDITFLHYTKRESLNGNVISALFQDSRGNVWVGTEGGLCQYTANGEFIHYSTKDGLIDNKTLSLAEDEEGKLWVGAQNGLTCFTPENVEEQRPATFAQFTTKEGLLSNEISAIKEDRNGYLWLGTNAGASRFDGTHLIHFPNEIYFDNNSVRCVLEDDAGKIWFGTGGGGIYRLDPVGFYHLTAKRDLVDNDFTAMAEDQAGNLWFGSNGGVIRYTPSEDFIGEQLDSFTYFTPANGLIGPEILAITGDRQGKLWIGTSQGVSCFDGSSFSQYTIDQGLVSNEVKSFLEDSRGNIWLGTTSGVSCFDGTHFTEFTTREGLISNQVRCMLEDRKGNIWLGTSEGVSCFTPSENAANGQQGNMIHFTVQEGLPGNDIRTLLEDSMGNIWMGTHGNGLTRYHPQKKRFTNFTTHDGLVNNIIWSLAEDHEGNIWISTEKGISCLQSNLDQQADTDEITQSIPLENWYTFEKEEGLRRLDFQANSALHDRYGRIWWGSVSGLMMLDLNRFELSQKSPRNLALTHLEINQQFIDYQNLIHIEKRGLSPLEEKLSGSYDSVAAFYNYPTSLTLPYDLNDISFHFSAIEWKRPQKIKYQYQLEELDKEWSLPDHENKVTYRNLDYGTYTFKVRSGGEAQHLSVPFYYTFVVSPPWWLSWGAYLVYSLLIMIASYMLFTLIKKRWMLKQALKRKEEEASRLMELDEARTRFFTNVSHELRTPLSLVIGPLKIVIREAHLTKRHDRLLEMAQRNGRQLEMLINEILDLRKLESGLIKLNPVPTSLPQFFTRYFVQFESLAEQKAIDFDYVIAYDQKKMITIDREKCRQILYNLLSNAFKFTPSGGEVKAKISLTDGQLQIAVTDNGLGVHPDDLPHLFDRYFQTKHPERPVQGGTGIGLALCREYVTLLGGEIAVKSELGKGSHFSVQFPVSIATLEQSKADHKRRAFSDESDRNLEPMPSSISTGGMARSTLMVVEDNPDLQEYLQLILSQNYNVIIAGNGEKAWQILTSVSTQRSGKVAATPLHPQAPSLVISDLMMPVMDGFQLLERMKSEESTRHLPVIMLTARVGNRDRLKALRIGVDDYLTKPFDEEELLVRVANLLRNQTARKQEEPAEPIGKEKKPVLSQVDQEWLIQFETYVRNHLSSTMLSIPGLAHTFAMSESTLLRQLKRLTGLTPVRYLQEMRLDVARRLLEERTYQSIAEVASKVGYDNAKSFSRSFKKRFGKLPSEVQEI